MPGRLPRLVATDLDGTLLHSDGTVTERTRSVLAALETRGVTVVFVTGRPIRWMGRLWQHVGDHGLAVCSNGGIVYDVRAHAVRTERPLDRALVLDVAGRLRAEVPGTSFALERPDDFAKESDFAPSDPPPEDLLVGRLEDVVDDRTVKLLARHEDLAPEEFWTLVEAAVGQLCTTTWSSTGALVEISAAGVTKASTLQLLCEEQGIGAEEVVAFGDMPNDLAMLAWAGLSYAMANAHPAVLAGADRVAPDHDEDGVALTLERIFGLGGNPH